MPYVPTGGGGSVPNTITIGETGDYTTIADAMSAITDASASKIYTLLLTPTYKTYTNLWDTMTWKPYVLASWAGGRTEQWYGSLQAWNGVDFTECAIEGWQPWWEPSLYLKLGAQDENENETADLTSLVAEAAGQGEIYLVIDTGAGRSGLYCLSTNNPAQLADWINITTELGSTFSPGPCDQLEASAINAAGAQFCGRLSLSKFYRANATGTSFAACDLSKASFLNADCTNADFDSANLLGVDFTGTILTGATLPANADTKAEFKALVGAWDAVTTIWTDGNPIG